MNETSFPLFYASHDGHTRKIAETLAAQLQARGISTTLWDLAVRLPEAADLPAPERPIFLMAAIRYGFHLPPARAFIKKHYNRLKSAPLILVSVNLTARKPQKRTAQTNLYLRNWIRRSRLTPVITAALGGYLNYPRYRLFDRLMIQLIMTLTGGPTDPTAQVDYTPWDEVEVLATKIADLYDLQRGQTPAQLTKAS